MHMRKIMKNNKSVILSYARTPFGSFLGKLSKFSASYLGAQAIMGALKRANLDSNLINEVTSRGEVVDAKKDVIESDLEEVEE